MDCITDIMDFQQAFLVWNHGCENFRSAVRDVIIVCPSSQSEEQILLLFLCEISMELPTCYLIVSCPASRALFPAVTVASLQQLHPQPAQFLMSLRFRPSRRKLLYTFYS